MFCLELSPTYFWPVHFASPKADGSGREACTFSAEFKRLKVPEIDALAERTKREQLDDAQVAAEVLCGWRHIVDSRGTTVEFNEGSMKALLALPGVASAIVRAFFDSLSDPSAGGPKVQGS